MPASLYGLAKIHVREEKYREALPEIDAAVRLSPDNQNVHFMRGRILLKLGRERKARRRWPRRRSYSTRPRIERLPTAMGSDDDEPVRNPELAQPPQ